MAVQVIVVFQTDLGWYVRFNRQRGPFATRQLAIDAAEAVMRALDLQGERGQIIVAENAA